LRGPRLGVALLLVLAACSSAPPADDDDATEVPDDDDDDADDDDSSASDDDDDSSASDDDDSADASVGVPGATCATPDVVAVMGGSGYFAIQDALDEAAGAPVAVCAGTHLLGAPLWVNPGEVASLTSDVADAASTVLDGGGLVRLLIADGAESLTLEQLTFTGGFSDARGGAVVVRGSTDVTVADCVFSGNVGFDGGALAVIQTDLPHALTLERTAFVGNEATSSGGALMLDGDGDAEVVVGDCTFEGNTAGYAGAGIYLQGVTLSGSLDVVDTTFADQIAGFTGGAATFSWGADGGPVDVSFTGCSMTSLSAGYSGAALQFDWFNPDGSLTLTDTVVDSNTADDDGGTIVVEALQGPFALSFVDSAITRNTHSSGAAVMIDERTSISSVATDWGAGFANNLPADLETPASTAYLLGESETFSCAAGEACPPE